MNTQPLYVLRVYGLCYVVLRALMTLITWLTHGPGAELSKGPRLDCAQSLIAIGVTYSTWVIVLAIRATILFFLEWLSSFEWADSGFGQFECITKGQQGQ
jgi:hypothetical protein